MRQRIGVQRKPAEQAAAWTLPSAAPETPAAHAAPERARPAVQPEAAQAHDAPAPASQPPAGHSFANVAVFPPEAGRAPELGAGVRPGAAPLTIQRRIGDGHDLTSTRFSLLEDLEAAYDSEQLVQVGSTGRGVQAIQHALYDLGFTTPEHGADGRFGAETRAAVRAFQRANPPLAPDGVVGPKTMEALDQRFGGAPPIPAEAQRGVSPWTPAVVRDILKPWSPHTVEVLRTRITLKSFDSISWADEVWDGSNWVVETFPGGGYNTGTEIGVLNRDTNEQVSETLYHEVLHAEQPRRQTTTLARESYAYRIGEEFSIALGLGGRPDLRSSDPQGREFADPAKVDAFVASEYPSVPAGGGDEEIIGKASTHGHVEVQDSSGRISTRPAQVGDKVAGPMQTSGEVAIDPAVWS